MLALDKLMVKQNSFYYKNKRLYSDFLTYAQRKNNILGQATAINFSNKFLQSNSKILNVLEIGCGNGSFALSFLTTLKKKNKELFKKINYTLADFSDPILNSAFNNIKKSFPSIKLKKIIFDANAPSLFKPSLHFDYIRANELLTDLAAKVFVKKENFFYEVLYDKDLNFSFKKIKKPSNQIKELLNYFPEGFFIPINFSAKKLVTHLYNFLSKEAYVEFFDYGFFSKEDFILDSEEWNKLIVRKYSSQITVDLNFFYLYSYFRAKKISAKVELQSDYVKNIFGQQPSIALYKNGLDYAFKNSNFEFQEQDYFYVLSLEKNKKI
ncbi:MAG: SAM-dependent methyltransferase [Candidatus Micrarchaeota archaeon]|nr:SAM-dependent methyltransferase [Candidatus Micrarchaeota archaeon]